MKQIIIPIVLCAIFFTSCAPKIDSFEECVQAGNPVMESYPRQCRAGGQTFVEDISDSVQFTECKDSPDACTKEYRPVCAFVDNGIRCIKAPCQSFDAQTFSNACTACSSDASGYYPGLCDTQKFVICKETQTGFDAKEHAKNIGGICVDICPGNYDPYTTQIGVQLCIEHFGSEEINSWSTCDRSSKDCDCIRAYETTDSLQIQDAKYRCVPEQYAQRLLFRAGIDRLDEQGKSSVVIA